LTTRSERRQNKSNKSPDSGQKPWMLWGGAAIVVIAIVIVAFVALSPDDSDGSALVTGGSFIGDPNAPVTLVEFADFQ
jgi:protein-disulfide isomerase